MQISQRKLIISATIVFIVLCQENFFYLTQQYMMFVLSLTGIIILILEIPNILTRHYFFKIPILLMIVTLIFGIILAKIFYNQPILTGLYGNHYIFIYGWYFLVCDLFERKDREELMDFSVNTFLIMALILVSLVLAQGIFFPNTNFLRLLYSTRDGVRIGGCFIAAPAFSLAISREMHQHSILQVAVIVATGLYLFFFNQSRSLIIILSLVVVIVVLQRLKGRGFLFYPSDFGLILILLIAIFAFRTPIYKMIVSTTSEFFSGSGTGGVRFDELSYYFSSLQSHHFFGIGLLASQFPLTRYIYGTEQYMFLEDVGMTSVIFKVGMLALVSTIVFLVRIVQSLKRLPNSWNKYLALTELCQMTIGGLSTQIFDGKYSLIYFLLVLAWIEPSISQCIGTNTRDFGV